MRRVALKGLWWRRGRAVLTAFAVVLGVAMVSGTFILTDTINKAFDSIFQESYSNTSAVISGKEVVQEATSGEILALLREAVDGFGQTTVMVTHDPHAAAIADRVLFLADGRIVRDTEQTDATSVIRTMEEIRSA